MIEQIFCTREFFNAVPSIQASMTKNAMEDLTGCLHYSDDWELMREGAWSDTYNDPKVAADALIHCIPSIESWSIDRWI
jgi:hypothetical protein